MQVRFTIEGAVYRRALDKAGSRKALDALVGYVLDAYTREVGEPGRIAPEAILAARRALGENRDTFGARWHVSGRTVESWEQGIRRPPTVVAIDIMALASR